MMSNLSEKIFFLFHIFVVCSLVEGREKQKDYLILKLVWPNSVCNYGDGNVLCKQPIPQNFKVFSLWRYKSSSVHLSNSFSKLNVKNWNFTSRLSSVWPHLLHSETDIAVWEWNWNTYGIASEMSPENYFYSAVKYAEKYEHIYHFLLKSGVVPSSDRLYEHEVLYDRIRRAVDSSPEIRCIEVKNIKELSSISVCINKHGEAFDCPNSLLSCGGPKEMILFATDKTNMFR